MNSCGMQLSESRYACALGSRRYIGVRYRRGKCLPISRSSGVQAAFEVSIRGSSVRMETTCAEQFPVGPDDRAPHRMPEQGDIVRIRGDERFAQVLGEAMYLETEVRFLRFTMAGRGDSSGTQWCGMPSVILIAFPWPSSSCRLQMAHRLPTG